MNYDDLKKIALEKYAGDEAKAEAFCEGFAKEAADALEKEAFDWAGMGRSIQDNAVSTVGKGVGNVAVNAVVSGIGNIIGGAKNLANHRKFLEALEKAIQLNRVLKAADRQRILAYGETVFKFAPHVAMDPNMLASILANAVHGDGLDPMTIRTLTELEAKYTDNVGFSPKNYS